MGESVKRVPNPVILPPSLYDYAKSLGFDMSMYVKSRKIPLSARASLSWPAKVESVHLANSANEVLRHCRIRSVTRKYSA